MITWLARTVWVVMDCFWRGNQRQSMGLFHFRGPKEWKRGQGSGGLCKIANADFDYHCISVGTVWSESRHPVFSALMRTENPTIMIRFEKFCVLHSKERMACLIIFWLDGHWAVSLLLSTAPACPCDRTAVLNLFWKHLDELLKLPEVEDLPHFKLLKVANARVGDGWLPSLVGAMVSLRLKSEE